jgi:hypothetical protein
MIHSARVEEAADEMMLPNFDIKSCWQKYNEPVQKRKFKEPSGNIYTVKLKTNPHSVPKFGTK